MLCLDLVDRHELRGWLGDNRKMNSIEPADLQWTLDVFVPQAVASPLLRMANLPSEFEQNREAVAMMIEKKNQLNEQLLVRDFDTQEEAMAWLMEL